MEANILKTILSYMMISNFLLFPEVALSKPLDEIHLTADSNLLYGENGIYTNPKKNGREWEIPGAYIFKDASGSVKAAGDIGLRIHGGSSRSRGAKKSLKIYFRDDYGQKSLPFDLFNRGEDPFIKSKTRKIVLRAGFNDSWNYDRDNGRNGQKRLASYIKDQVARDLSEDMGMLSSRGVFVQVYLNKKYIGLFNAVEAIDEDNFSVKGVKKSQITIMSSNELKNGSESDWSALMASLDSMDYSSDSFYDLVAENLDMENFTSYVLLNAYLQNYDWPKHNWKAVKFGPLQKWKFMMWDVEYSFGSGNKGFKKDLNIFDIIKSQPGPLPMLISALLKNRKFVKKLSERYEKSKEILKESKISLKINGYASEIKEAIEVEGKLVGVRYGLREWKRALDKMYEFLYSRTNPFEMHLNDLQEKYSDSIICESKDFAFNKCFLSDKKIISVIQLSQSKCVKDTSWGLDEQYIWVNKGCRAEFRVF